MLLRYKTKVFKNIELYNAWGFQFKGEATFKTTFLDLIVALPYFRNILVKKPTMPQKWSYYLQIIPIWLWVVAAIFI